MRWIKFILAFCLFPSAALAQTDASRAVPHVVVVFDDSGSMDSALSSSRGTSKLEAAKQSLITVLSQVDDNAKVGIYLLNGQYDTETRRTLKWWVPLGKLDRDKAISRIKDLKTNGGTPLGSAMKGGCDALIEARKQDHYGSYRLLIVSDGEANYGHEANLVEKYTPDIMARGYITVDVIGVDMRGNHTLATKVHNYRSASDAASLERAIHSVFAETSPNDANSAEDYALTAALPEDMAVKVIHSLSETGTHAVGETPVVKVDDKGNASVQQAEPIKRWSTVGIVLGFACAGILGLVVICVLVKVANE